MYLSDLMMNDLIFNLFFIDKSLLKFDSLCVMVTHDDEDVICKEMQIRPKIMNIDIIKKLLFRNQWSCPIII